MKIGITDYVKSPFSIEAEALGDGHSLHALNFDRPDTEPDQALLATIEGLLVWHTVIDEALLSKMPALKIIVRYGVGFDNIDLEAVARAGILFSNTPDYGTEEVADTACAMILEKVRRVSHYNAISKKVSEGWQEHVLPEIRRSNQLTLGIVGAGRIGSAVILRMKAFGFTIKFFDPYKCSGHEKTLGCERVHSLKDLLQSSDIISLHCPLTEETKALVDTEFLEAMKPGSVLVNTARGELIADLGLVFDAVRKNHLYGAALDVLPEEPPTNSNDIEAWRHQSDYLDGRITINPHTAYYSQEAWHEMRYKAAETICLWANTGQQRNAIMTLPK